MQYFLEEVLEVMCSFHSQNKNIYIRHVGTLKKKTDKELSNAEGTAQNQGIGSSVHCTHRSLNSKRHHKIIIHFVQNFLHSRRCG